MNLKDVARKARIRERTMILTELFPLESYGSVSSLFIAGRNAGIITSEELSEAREYYGRLWSYSGD